MLLIYDELTAFFLFMNLLKYAYLIIFLLALKNDLVFAQIVPDNTLKEESSQVTSSEQEQTINGGAVRGENLFHSFEEFNVKENQAVNFVNPEGVENIFSRVTGNNISQILGDLGVLGNANLFLLNPNGIVFGEKASLNLNGSFVATTADSINFVDGFRFIANSTEQKPLLTVNIPIGLQFDNQPGKIINQAQSPEKAASNGQFNKAGSPAGLLVQSNQTIALIGGEIIFEGGNITASGGNIEIASVGANSLISFSSETSNISFDYSKVSSFLDITLTNREEGLLRTFEIDENDRPIEVFVNSPIPSLIDANSENTSGNINLIGKNISIVNGSQIQALTLGNVSGGNISIEAQEQLKVSGRNFYLNQFPVFSLISTSTTGDGNAGNIQIASKRLIIEDSARIISNSFNTNNGGMILLSTGDGGSIFIDVSETVILRNQAAIFTDSVGLGEAGNTNLKTNNLILDNNSQIAASTVTSNGGNINLQVNNIIEISNQSNISASVGEDGNGGNVNISTNFLITSPQDNSDITANAERGQGGNIKINASGIFGFSSQKSPTNFSNITASSDSGIDGTVTLLNSEIQPDRTESDSQIQFVKVTPTFTPNYCYISKQNQYIRTGRGGIPLAAKNSLLSEYTWEDWRVITSEEIKSSSVVEPLEVQNQTSTVKPIQGWKVNQQGEIVLTADPITVTPYPTKTQSSGC